MNKKNRDRLETRMEIAALAIMVVAFILAATSIIDALGFVLINGVSMAMFIVVWTFLERLENKEEES